MKKSFMVIWVLILFSSMVNAKVLNVKYKVSFGVLGEMGIADAHLTTKGNNYTIDIGMKATGLAKVLSQNRKERHLSKGHIVNGMFISDTYKVIKTYGKKYIEKTYYIDHKKKRVRKDYLKKNRGKVTGEGHSVLDFYSKNDLLTLYFNLSKIIKNKSKAGIYKFSAVGAERQNGLVEVKIPTVKDIKKYEKTLGKGDYWYMTAIIYQKIFSSNKGEVMLAVGKDGIAQKAVLKDLIMFGDLVSKRIK
ncbi:MAG: hypothetical protein P794_01170 [Epsilonproteobacteria bacterium (ex Lamellibrachia satsuma)]|nr:MAG: hypothetical protein P794_01170 [Epsilonproteobacteria bacterium (ex Lamellibrachia satsuma)]